jgi:hypothetical protein
MIRHVTLPVPTMSSCAMLELTAIIKLSLSLRLASFLHYALRVFTPLLVLHGISVAETTSVALLSTNISCSNNITSVSILGRIEMCEISFFIMPIPTFTSRLARTPAAVEVRDSHIIICDLEYISWLPHSTSLHLPTTILTSLSIVAWIDLIDYFFAYGKAKRPS